MAQKITLYLLISLILSLGFGQLLRFEYFDLPLYFHDLVVILILCLNLKKIRFLLNPQSQIRLLLFGLALSWLNALFHYPLLSLLIPSLYTLRLLSYLALYLILRHSSLVIFRSVFLLSGATTLALGLAQYYFLPDMRWAQYLGWDDHLSRLTLPHFDPTFTAVMLVLFLLSVFPKYLQSNSLLCALCFVLTIPAILLTYARSVWLSLAFTLLSFVKNKVVAVLILSAFLLAVIALPRRFGEGTNLLRTYSLSSRLTSDLSYLEKYQWDLLIGRGLNTIILDQDRSVYPNHATGPNNSYLYILLTSGIVGLVGWGMFLKSLYQSSRSKPMLIFFLLASLFNNVLFYPFALLWVLLIESTMAPTST